ncbi:MAG TPA: thiamine phosphate synthase, partial [Vicinamibacterales bacterium]|nr:thiamine phosphate synthase [Vicinamibacterales bacterium]
GRAFLEGGARLIQIRAKHLASGPLLEIADRLVALAGPYDAAIIVNDRADVARMTRTAGVHVGQDDISPSDARAIVGRDAVVGYSTHTVEQVEAAVGEPVTYIAVGPVFGTRTKDTGYEAVGLDLVSAAAARAGQTPIVGIGGISLDNAKSVLDAGASAVAVISDLVSTGDPRRRVAAYLERLVSP